MSRLTFGTHASLISICLLFVACCPTSVLVVVLSLGPSLPTTKGASKEKSPAVRIQRNEGRRKTERRTRSRRISSFGVQRRERDEGEGERESRMAVRGGFREEGGTDGGCREGVRKMSQLTELEKI